MLSSGPNDLVARVEATLTANDRERSATLRALPARFDALKPLSGRVINLGSPSDRSDVESLGSWWQGAETMQQGPGEA